MKIKLFFKVFLIVALCNTAQLSFALNGGANTTPQPPTKVIVQ